MRQPLQIFRIQIIVKAEIKGKQVGKISELTKKTFGEIGMREIEELHLGERSEERRYETSFEIITAEIQMSQALQFKQLRTYLTSKRLVHTIKFNWRGRKMKLDNVT